MLPQKGETTQQRYCFLMRKTNIITTIKRLFKIKYLFSTEKFGKNDKKVLSSHCKTELRYGH